MNCIEITIDSSCPCPIDIRPGKTTEQPPRMTCSPPSPATAAGAQTPVFFPHAKAYCTRQTKNPKMPKSAKKNKHATNACQTHPGPSITNNRPALITYIQMSNHINISEKHQTKMSATILHSSAQDLLASWGWLPCHHPKWIQTTKEVGTRSYPMLKKTALHWTKKNSWMKLQKRCSRSVTQGLLRDKYSILMKLLIRLRCWPWCFLGSCVGRRTNKNTAILSPPSLVCPCVWRMCVCVCVCSIITSTGVSRRP